MKQNAYLLILSIGSNAKGTDALAAVPAMPAAKLCFNACHQASQCQAQLSARLSAACMLIGIEQWMELRWKQKAYLLIPSIDSHAEGADQSLQLCIHNTSQRGCRHGWE